MKYLRLYEQYLQITNPKSDGFTSVKCPFHDDSDKSAAVSLETGVFNCLACKRTYAPAKFISVISGKKIEEAGTIVETYRADTKIAQVNDNFSKKFIMAEEKQEWRLLYRKSLTTRLEDTFAVEYAESHGIDIQILKDNYVGFLKAEDTPGKWRRDSLTFPYFYNGKLVGLRFRDREGSKSGLEKSLFIPGGLDKVTEDDKAVILVEGETDALRLMTMLKKYSLNYKVIWSPGSAFKREWHRDLDSFQAVISIVDSDDAGSTFREQLDKELKFAHKPISLKWKPKQLGKDLTEWLSQNDDDILLKEITRQVERIKSSGGIQTTSAFLDEVTEIENPYITHFLYPGQVGVIGGPQKSKKTWLLLNLVKALGNIDSNFLGIPEFKVAETPKILFVEAEGSKKKFKERINLVRGEDSLEHVNWWWKPGIKLDTEKGLDLMLTKLEADDYGLLIIDPYQKFHSSDEDSSSDTAAFWNNIFEITSRFPRIAVIIIHHFGKDKGISDRWNAFRGSSRLGGEVDFGVFMEPKSKSEDVGIAFEFRDEESLTTSDGKDVFVLNFNAVNGSLAFDVEECVPDRTDLLIAEIRKRGGKMELTEACQYFNVPGITISRWVKKSDQLTKTRSAPGKPSIITVIEN